MKKTNKSEIMSSMMVFLCWYKYDFALLCSKFNRTEIIGTRGYFWFINIGKHPQVIFFKRNCKTYVQVYVLENDFLFFKQKSE